MNRFTTKALRGVAKYFPSALWWRYGRQARRLGFERLYLVLSFDCDTPEDISAAERVDAWLRARGIKATYAVPGAQLEQGAAVYRRLADLGADFINHGARPHAERRDGRYHSVTFYHEMTDAEVVDDIRRGHAIVQRTIGRAPQGFRAPHFGLFQEPAQLALLQRSLRDLGYRFDTSTVPLVGLWHGPVSDVGGLYEVPLSGSYRAPLDVLDSWGCIRSPHDPVVTEDYATSFTETIDQLLRHQVPGVLNYYVDPAHVADSAAFYRALEHVVARGVPTLHYGDVLGLVERRLGRKPGSKDLTPALSLVRRGRGPKSEIRNSQFEIVLV